MWRVHLHALGRDAPFRFLEVDFGPFRESKLKRSQDHERRQLQSTARLGLPVIAIDRQEELTHLIGIRDRRVVFHDDRRQRVSQ